MTIYKIETHDPISGYAYGKQTFATLEAAKRWLSTLLRDVRDAGIAVREEETEQSYEIAFCLGNMYYQYRVVSEYPIF